MHENVDESKSKVGQQLSDIRVGTGQLARCQMASFRGGRREKGEILLLLSQYEEKTAKYA